MLKNSLYFKKAKSLKSSLSISSLIFVQGLFYSTSAQASSDWRYEGAINLIHQQANDKKIDQNTSISADLMLLRPTQNGEWAIHFEGSSTPNSNGVSNIIQDSNADAGSSLTNRDQGRFQVSELNYRHHFQPNLALTFGLVDATAFLDSSEIMNDENNHFISASLVNNPIIDFPDYVVGGALEISFTQSISASMFVSSTHGIADNNSRNYASLFEVNEDEKGLFSAFEFQYREGNTFIHNGFWLHNGKHDALDGSDEDDLSNFGAYLSAGYQNGQHQYESRFGIANDEVSSASSFFALAYQYQIKQWHLGVGYSATQFSSKLIEPQKNTETLEAYLNIPFNNAWHISPSVQWFNQPIYQSNETDIPSNVMTANIRINYRF